jgi:hypothetical protein
MTPQTKVPDGYTEPECPQCDLKAIDDLHCEAQRITKEAAATAESSEELATMRTEFEEARTSYLGARADAQTALVVIDGQIESLKSSFDCLYNDENKKEVIDCLKASHARVREELRSCGDGPTGCCINAGDCEFAEEAPPGEIAARIEEYTAKVTKAKACFDALKKEPKPVPEPAGLPQRVETLQTAVTTLIADKCSEEGDWKTLYVRFLKVVDDRQAIWRGFATVTAYVDCLCLALTCVLKGKKALAKLEGQRAFLTCQDTKKDDRCQALRDHFIEEVIADYERTCGKEPCEPEAAATDPPQVTQAAEKAASTAPEQTPETPAPTSS